MPKKEWEYYSLHWIESSQQWQIEQAVINENNVTHWNYLDDACNFFAEMKWEPILLNNNVILFRRKKTKTDYPSGITKERHLEIQREGLSGSTEEMLKHMRSGNQDEVNEAIYCSLMRLMQITDNLGKRK